MGPSGARIHCFVLSNPPRVSRKDVPMNQARGNPGAPALPFSTHRWRIHGCLSPSFLSLSLSSHRYLCPWFKGTKCSKIFLITWFLGEAAGLQWQSRADVCKEGWFVCSQDWLQNSLLPYLPKDLADPRRQKHPWEQGFPGAEQGSILCVPNFFFLRQICCTEGFGGSSAPKFRNISKPMNCTTFCPLPRVATATSQGK